MAGNANSGGRNRKSAQMHLVGGTYRKDRHNQADDVVAPDGKPAMPKSLKGAAKAEWDRMVERMDSIHTLTKVDDAALYQYCKLFAETEALETDREAGRKMTHALRAQTRKLDGAELVEAITQIVKLKHLEGKIAVQIRQGRMALRQYLVEFGMTPSARTRVKPTKGASTVKQSKLGAFLGGA
ncbi:MAG: P27 family phage terminase small subunit [Vicinamibacterales bacterium]